MPERRRAWFTKRAKRTTAGENSGLAPLLHLRRHAPRKRVIQWLSRIAGSPACAGDDGSYECSVAKLRQLTPALDLAARRFQRLGMRHGNGVVAGIDEMDFAG